MKDIAQELREHPFFEAFDEETLAFVAGCGMNVVYKVDEQLAREGEPANEFFVVKKGRLALEMHSSERGRLQLETLDAGDLFGWSFMVPPYRWPVSARAVQVVHTIRMDGECIRKKCDEDPRLGYTMMRQFAVMMARRLDATRMQLMDLYGKLEL